MANEITFSMSLKFKDGDETLDVVFNNLSIDVSGEPRIHNKQTVGTSEEALLLGDVSTGGVLVVANRDSTNFVELRSGTGATNNIKIKAGEAWAFRTSDDAAAPYAIADTASVQLEYWLFSD